MENKLKTLVNQAEAEIKKTDSILILNQVTAKYLGRSGELTALLRGMKALSAEERPKCGALVNSARDKIEAIVAEQNSKLEMARINDQLAKEKVDITIPAKPFAYGTEHPIAMVQRDICELLVTLGFEVRDGREIESDYYAFEALNMPKNHPARDQQDTFYINEEVLLRPHTSSQQIRYMKEVKPPIKLCSTGKVFRVDELDATHTPSFNQLEGLVVDKNITMADLKGTLLAIFKHLYGDKVQIRMRPSFFPFTEPSVEVDATCTKCGGKGCTTCGGTGLIELLGAGMVHSSVLEECGIDSKVYSGFAFGMGIDRITMLKYGITDIRDLYENDIRLLKQV